MAHQDIYGTPSQMDIYETIMTYHFLYTCSVEKVLDNVWHSHAHTTEAYSTGVPFKALFSLVG